MAPDEGEGCAERRLHQNPLCRDTDERRPPIPREPAPCTDHRLLRGRRNGAGQMVEPHFRVPRIPLRRSDGNEEAEEGGFPGRRSERRNGRDGQLRLLRHHTQQGLQECRMGSAWQLQGNARGLSAARRTPAMAWRQDAWLSGRVVHLRQQPAIQQMGPRHHRGAARGRMYTRCGTGFLELLFRQHHLACGIAFLHGDAIRPVRRPLRHQPLLSGGEEMDGPHELSV